MRRSAFKSLFQRSQGTVSGGSTHARSNSALDHLSIGNACLFLAVTASVVGLTAGLAHSRHADAVTHQPAESFPVRVNTSSDGTDGQGSIQTNTSSGTSQQAAASSSSVRSTVNTDGQSTTSVTVNGQPVAVPQNGTNQQTINSPNGTTSVSVSNNQSSDGSSYSTSVTTTTNNSVQSSFNSNDVVNFESHTGSGSTPP